MSRNRSKLELLSRTSIAVSAIAWATATAAQTGKPNEPQTSAKASNSREDAPIIVTARQRSETLQNVPATITAFVASDIKAANITRPADFINLTPGVSQVQTLEVGDLQVNIRGINSGRDTESSVALLIDGVLVTNPNAINQELDNITQIEVLKGPQGALYGRNALAGAMIFTTRKPTNKFEGYLKAGVGRYGLWSTSAGVSGPIAPGVKFGLSAYHRQENGSYTNSFRQCNDCENFQKENGVTGRLIINPTDKLELDLKARYSKVKAGGVTFNASLALTDAAAYLNVPGFFEDPNKHNFIYLNRNNPDNQQESLNLSAKGTVHFSLADMTLIGTYNNVKNNFISAGVSNAFGIYNANSVCMAEYANALADPVRYAVPSPFFYTPNIANSFLPPYPPITCGGYQYQQRDQKDASAEVRLTSTGGGAFKWMLGGYFATINRHLVVAYGGDLGTGVLQKGFVPKTGPNPTDLLYDDNLYSKVYAGFANAAYNIRPNLELALAMRYDVEARRVRNNVPKMGPQTPGFGAFGVPVCPNGPDNCSYFINPFYNANPTLTSIPGRQKTYRQLQPKATVNWKPSEELTIYASYGYGFRSGGFNSSGTTATLLQFFGNLALPNGTKNLNNLTDDFKKEVSKAAEVGFKARLMGGSLTLNGALFHTVDENGQDFSFFAGPFGSLRVVTNIDRAILKGFEADFRWRPVSELSLFGGFGYTHSEIKKYSTRPYTVGNKVPYVPSYNANLGAEYRMRLANSLKLLFRVDESFVGKTWFSPVQKNILPNFFTAFGFGRGDFSRQFRAPYATTNLNLTLQSGNWDVGAWGTNVFNKKYLSEIIPAPEFGGSFIHDSYGRTYGIRASYKFGGS
jgi:iron complex outermembrane receptor protein